MVTWKLGQKEKMVGVYDKGVWYLDLKGNGVWEGAPGDGPYYFGDGLTEAALVANK